MSDLYVGYLKTPGAHKALLRVVLPLVIVLFAVVAAAVSAQMRDPGEAVWDIASSKQWTGRLVEDPFPMLITDEGEAVLIVEIGKFGALPRLQDHIGKRVTLEGFPLERDGRKMIELLEGDDAFVSISDDAGRAVENVVGDEPVAMVGEIVDGKCFLGAMKPGDGKAHKACAVLCIRGGLPPMVRTRDEAGAWIYPLLMVDGSTDLPDRVLDLIAEPVRIEGALGRVGDLWVISCDGECVRPYPDLAGP